MMAPLAFNELILEANLQKIPYLASQICNFVTVIFLKIDSKALDRYLLTTTGHLPAQS